LGLPMNLARTLKIGTMNNKRPILFLGVGVFNTLLDFVCYTSLTLTIFSSKSVALAGIVSGTIALMVAFLTHSLITWRGRNVSKMTAVRFLLFTGFGMWVIRPILLAAFAKLPGVYNFTYDISQAISLPFSKEFITNTGAFGFMIIIVLTYNYFTYDRFVFHKEKLSRTEPENHLVS
jgi:putative flippase GtrA